MSRHPRSAYLLFFAFALLLLAPAALAQDERPLTETPLPEDLPGEESVEKTPPAKKPDLPGDWKVYVPFKDLQKVFEKEGQGVFVPFEEFLKLWESNLDKRPVPADPPVASLVTRATYEGRVEGDLAVIKGTIEFETFSAGWSAVPLGLRGIALGEAVLDGAPATVQAVKGGYRVLVPKKGEYALEVSFVTPIAKAEDARTIAFQMPPVPVSRLTFDIPEEEARVVVEPNLATTRTEPGSGVTRVMAFVGASDKVKLTWRPRPAEVVEGPALVFADAVVHAAVGEAAVRVKADFTYRIHRAPVEEFKLFVAPDASVLFVEGEDLRSWDVEGNALTVQLLKPVENGYRLSVTLEKERPASGRVAVPVVHPTGAAREQGYVLVSAPKDTKVLPEAAGLFRADFNDVPKNLRPADMILAYRYPAQPWALGLDVTRIEPVVDVTGRTTIRIDERRLQTTEALTYAVAKAGIFQARVALPEGIEITDVSRDTVEDWRITDGVLELDLKGRKIGNFTVIVSATRVVGLEEEPLSLDLPLMTPLGVRRVEGLVGIIREESLKLETRDVVGLIPVEATRFGGGAAVAFQYRAAERSAGVVLSRRDPEVSAVVATELRAEENRIAVKSRILYTIRYAGVDEFAFTLPAELREQIEVTGTDIREKPVEDLEEEGLIRQRVVLQGKVMGTYEVVVEYDLAHEGLGTGEARSVAIPALTVLDVERERGFYVVFREPMLEIVEDVDALEPIDPRELPPGVGGRDAFLAFKYLQHPHSLTLKVDKHEFLPTLSAVVHHMHLVTVLNDEGKARTEVILKMTNNGQQFLSMKLEGNVSPDSLEIWTWVRRNNRNELTKKTAKPQAGEKDTILVRIPADAGPEDVFYVRFVYPVRREVPGLLFHGFPYAAPVIQGDQVPVLGTTWYLYPPPETKVIETGGSLRELTRKDSWWGSIVSAFPVVFSEARADTGPIRGESVPRRLTAIAPTGQKPLVFGGRSLSPSVEVVYADPGAFAFLKVLVLLGILAWGVFGLKAAARAKRVGFTTVCVAGPLLLIPVASVGMAEVLSFVMIGGILAGLYWCVRAAGPGLAAWAQSRRQPAPAASAIVEPVSGEEE